MAPAQGAVRPDPQPRESRPKRHFRPSEGQALAAARRRLAASPNRRRSAITASARRVSRRTSSSDSRGGSSSPPSEAGEEAGAIGCLIGGGRGGGHPSQSRKCALRGTGGGGSRGGGGAGARRAAATAPIAVRCSVPRFGRRRRRGLRGCRTGAQRGARSSWPGRRLLGVLVDRSLTGGGRCERGGERKESKKQARELARRL